MLKMLDDPKVWSGKILDTKEPLVWLLFKAEFLAVVMSFNTGVIQIGLSTDPADPFVLVGFGEQFYSLPIDNARRLVSAIEAELGPVDKLPDTKDQLILGIKKTLAIYREETQSGAKH
jgi:ABC-type amino acid transport substrate-binding protein